MSCRGNQEGIEEVTTTQKGLNVYSFDSEVPRFIESQELGFHDSLPLYQGRELLDRQKDPSVYHSSTRLRATPFTTVPTHSVVSHVSPPSLKYGPHTGTPAVFSPL